MTSVATHSEHAPLDLLTKTPYIAVLTYPRISLRVAKARIKQLDKLGVQELVFDGRSKIGRLGVLGLGTVGIVVKATLAGKTVALKVRRTDANREDMENEVAITSLVNRVGIGPELYAHSRDFVAMKFLEYEELHDWFKRLSGPGSRAQARAMVHAVLNQCRKLDIMGVDHGQLSNLRKHVVVAEGRPWIIDFESASRDRKTKNVTTAAQYLFIGGRLSPLLKRILGIRETTHLLSLLAEYKRQQNDFAYSRILEALKLSRV